MKLCALLLSSVAYIDGKKDRFIDETWSNTPGTRGGKHGRVQNDDLRYVWKIPHCVAHPDSPSCDNDCKGHFTEDRGEITVTKGAEYRSYQSCLWTIEVSPDREIFLMFDKKKGFDVEYHSVCGFDKLHVFSGDMDDWDNSKRHARFCGPRKGRKPFDGAGKIKATHGQMPFWDNAYNLGDNRAIIGFDSDQRFIGNGFTLKWWSRPRSNYNFYDVYDSFKFVQSKCTSEIRDVRFISDKRKSFYQTKMSNMLAKAVNALKNNPDGTGEKTRRCAKGEQQSVSEEVAMSVADMYAHGGDFNRCMTELESLVGEYLSKCKVGQKKWPEKIALFSADIQKARMPF